MKNYVIAMWTLSILGTAPVYSDTVKNSQSVTAPQKTNSADHRFIDQMKAHHEMAIEMAKMAEDKAANKSLREFAKKMTADQKKDVAKLEAWRKKWFGEGRQTMHDSGSMQTMGMNKLQQASGESFDQQFIEQMIVHHKQAITMSQEALKELDHPKLKRFARDIIAKQEEEVSKMEAMRKR